MQQSRTNSQRIMDAITGKAPEQELRLEILQENALNHQIQERQYQEFKAQEQAEKIQAQQRELDREYRSAREIKKGMRRRPNPFSTRRSSVSAYIGLSRSVPTRRRPRQLGRLAGKRRSRTGPGARQHRGKTEGGH